MENIQLTLTNFCPAFIFSFSCHEGFYLKKPHYNRCNISMRDPDVKIWVRDLTIRKLSFIRLAVHQSLSNHAWHLLLEKFPSDKEISAWHYDSRNCQYAVLNEYRWPTRLFYMSYWFKLEILPDYFILMLQSHSHCWTCENYMSSPASCGRFIYCGLWRSNYSDLLQTLIKSNWALWHTIRGVLIRGCHHGMMWNQPLSSCNWCSE